MSADHHAGKGYAPLPQSISNTDTEDEDERLTPLENAIARENHGPTITEPMSLCKNGAYYPLDETRNLANHNRNGEATLRYYRDNIPIMVVEADARDPWKRRGMSPIRRFCLVASILLCVATILVFLYVLPCDDSLVCPPINEPQSSVSWDNTLQGVELHGPISVIPGSPYGLVFLLRGQRYRENSTDTSEQREISREGNGVISMQGDTGLPLWKWLSSKRLPTDIDCVSIDTDRSGKPDCIVVGDQGLLASIEPTAGTAHWSAVAYTFSKLPVILPDVNSDGIEDLLSVDVTTGKAPTIVFLSGGTGQLLGRYVSHENCSLVDIYDLVSNGTLSYVCYDSDGKRVNKSVPFDQLLYEAISTQSHKKLIARRPAQPRLFETIRLDIEGDHEWKLTPYHHLSVENAGPCPGDNCRVGVYLTLQKNLNQSLPIWEYVGTNAVASKPAFLSTTGKPYTTGFAIKFWQWDDSVSVETKTESHIVKRKLTERVLIIFVNYTDVKVINASQNDVIQLCHGGDCQPNLDSRTRFSSIAITYIGNNELPELIDYWSSYDGEPPKRLISKVQVVKLDSVTSSFSGSDLS